MSYGTVQAEKMTTESGYSLGAGNASSFKNRIINGAMVFDQRNNGAAVTYTNTNSYNLDRYLTDMSPGGSLQVQQVADAPPGFVFSMRGTILTATAGSSGQAAYLARHIIEGNNVSDLAWGTANAKPVTISFWVKSSVTGTFAVGVANNAFNRGYPATYTISSANTWEYKSVTIPGDTSGTWLTTNGIGVRIYWDIGSGSLYQGTANTWQSAGIIGATGTTSIINTLNATFQITGLQFEVGTVATSFEYRSYGTELALCQRYTYIISGTSTFSNGFSRYMTFGTGSTGSLWFPTFPVQMRTPPSLLTKNFNGSFVDFYNYNTTVTPGFSSVVISEGDVWHAQVGINFSSGSGLTNLVSWRWSGNPDAYIGFSAEL